MKIGFFSDCYKPYVSGVVKSIESFSREYKKMGHEVYIFAPDYPGIEEKNNIYRFKSIPVVTHPKYRLAIPMSRTMIKKIKEINLDIIHTHSPFLMGWLGKIMAKRLDLPLVFTYHTLYEKYAHYAPLIERWARKLAITYTKRYCQYCDMVVAPSEYVKKRLIEYNISGSLLTVPTGIKISDFRKTDSSWIKDKYNLKKEEKILLFVGRLGKEKNVDFLLEAFKKISNNIPKTKLIIVGDGHNKAFLKKMVKSLNIEEKVIFTGLQPHENVIDFYQASDLFVFPSVTETQGLVILEAMAGGLPVVAVDAAGSQDMVDSGVNGMLVKEDQHVFAQSVINLLCNDNKYKLFRSNAEEKAREYTMTKMAKCLLKGYNKLLSDKELNNKQKKYLA